MCWQSWILQKNRFLRLTSQDLMNLVSFGRIKIIVSLVLNLVVRKKGENEDLFKWVIYNTKTKKHKKNRIQKKVSQALKLKVLKILSINTSTLASTKVNM